MNALPADRARLSLVPRHPQPASRVSKSMLDLVPARSLRPAVIGTLGALALHLALFAFAAALTKHEHPMPPAQTDLSVELPPPPQPSPVKEVPPPPAPAVRVLRAPATQPKAATPPAAARAAEVETAVEPVASGDVVVTGSSAAFAGGTTASTGTSSNAVTALNARAEGVEGAAHADLSRSPILVGAAVWDCPFPPEADEEGIDHAVVTLQVEVDATGQVLKTLATTDPGHGFGREARRCALAKPWRAGLDSSGAAVNSVALVNVRFDR